MQEHDLTPQSLEDAVNKAGLWGLLRKNSQVPAHHAYRLLLEAGLLEEDLRLHSWLKPDVFFSELVNAEITIDQDSCERLHLDVRRGGLSPWLPVFMKAWLRATEEGSLKTFRDFMNVVDDYLIKQKYSLETLHLARRSERDALSISDRFVVDLLGLRQEDWKDECGGWSRRDLRCWYRLVPTILRGARPQDQLLEALEVFFPFLRRGNNIALAENSWSKAMIPARHQARLSATGRSHTPVFFGDHWPVAFSTVTLRLGPLGVSDYWSFVSPELLPAEETATHPLGPPGLERGRLDKILTHLLPVGTEVEVILLVAPSERSSAFLADRQETPAILGHNAIMDDSRTHDGVYS